MTQLSLVYWVIARVIACFKTVHYFHQATSKSICRRLLDKAAGFSVSGSRKIFLARNCLEWMIICAKSGDDSELASSNYKNGKRLDVPGHLSGSVSSLLSVSMCVCNRRMYTTHTQSTHTHGTHTHTVHTHTHGTHTHTVHTHTRYTHTHTRYTHTRYTHTRYTHTHGTHTHTRYTHTHGTHTHTSELDRLGFPSHYDTIELSVLGHCLL